MSEWHNLYSGYLSDMPGRCESWTEAVRYHGRGQWTLRSYGTDFTGTSSGETYRERLSTKKLIHWVLERDSEDLDSEECDETYGEVCAPEKKLGERAGRLRDIAISVNAHYCKSLLDLYESGDWPSTPKAPKVLEITGVMKRGVWIRIYHAVYVANTTTGKAYIYPPNESGYSKLVLATSGSLNCGFQVRLSKQIKSQMEGFRKEFLQIKKEMS